MEGTIPALAFVFPYHEMLLRGLLRVGGHEGVKTRSSNWNYRGPVLLYTSKGKPHKAPMKAYNLDPQEFPNGAIVGLATLVDSRLLTWPEKIHITCNFNNINPNLAENALLGTEDDYITPLPYGVFLQDIIRFKKPVEFKPKPGSIGIMRVPLNVVIKAIRQACPHYETRVIINKNSKSRIECIRCGKPFDHSVGGHPMT